MKRLLPIGIQDFAGIREREFCDIDKTVRTRNLISSSEKAFFLSRPWRVGKSLFCSTLGAIFESRRKLFKGLAHVLGVAARAQGMLAVSRDAGVDRVGLYRSFTEGGDPRISTFDKVAHSLGCHLTLAFVQGHARG